MSQIDSYTSYSCTVKPSSVNLHHGCKGELIGDFSTSYNAKVTYSKISEQRLLYQVVGLYRSPVLTHSHSEWWTHLCLEQTLQQQHVSHCNCPWLHPPYIAWHQHDYGQQWIEKERCGGREEKNYTTTGERSSTQKNIQVRHSLPIATHTLEWYAHWGN